MSSGCTPVKSGSRCQQDTHCVHTVSEPEVITEVPLTMTTMQAVQDSWMGLVTPKTFCSTMRSLIFSCRTVDPLCWDRAWSVSTGSGQMRMCGDILAVAPLWWGCLLTSGHLSSRHPVVVGAGDVLQWGSLRRGGRKRDDDGVRVFNSVSCL